MKNKAITFGIILILIIAGGVLSVQAKEDNKGNRAPSGKHYNLNIIGVPHDMNPNFDGGNGARIFVDRTGQTQFYVYGGDSYEIRDHDGTDGKVGDPGLGYENAGIVLPYSEGEWRAQIWVRLVGPKDSHIKWKSEYWDGSDWALIEDWFDIYKSSKFTCETGRLLKDGYQDILWTMEPVTKFRNLQMRIYIEEVEV